MFRKLLEDRRLKRQGYAKFYYGESLCLIHKEIASELAKKYPDSRCLRMYVVAGVIGGPKGGMASCFPHSKIEMPDIPIEEWRQRSWSADIEVMTPKGERIHAQAHGRVFNRKGVWEALSSEHLIGTWCG